MNREHEWLLIMIPKLEQALVQAGQPNPNQYHKFTHTLFLYLSHTQGVGVGVRNRYCVVGFGSFAEFERGHFVLVDGQPCFFASDFPRAR